MVECIRRKLGVTIKRLYSLNDADDTMVHYRVCQSWIRMSITFTYDIIFCQSGLNFIYN